MSEVLIVPFMPAEQNVTLDLAVVSNLATAGIVAGYGWWLSFVAILAVVAALLLLAALALGEGIS